MHKYPGFEPEPDGFTNEVTYANGILLSINCD